MSASRRKTELIRLVEKVLKNKATLEEKQFVQKYYDYFDKEGFDSFQLSAEEKQQLKDKILRDINSKIDDTGKSGRVSSVKGRYRRVAAAAAVLVAAAGMFYWYRGEPRVHQTAVAAADRQPEEDISPGGNKAVLTLANGSKIMLDDAHDGLLTRQRGTRISKINGGSLVYHVSSAMKNPVDEQPAVQYNTLSVPRGGRYRVDLPDGTKVWLNSASSLTYPTAFKGRVRTVDLQGEAYFEVAENKEHAFRVRVGNTIIEDLGTHFNVMAYTNEPGIKTTLLEGAVKVSKGGKAALLQPGQQAITDRHGSGDIRVVRADVNKAVAWKNGFFSFHRTSIYEIMRQISRWYDVDVRYEDSLHVFLNGSISRQANITAMLKMLELTGELGFTVQDKKIIVKSLD